MSGVLGIDLGTANACAAVFHEGTVHVVPNAEGSRVTPSVCAYQPSDGTWLVGHTARRQAAGNLQNTVYAPLRLLGRRFDSPEIRRMADRVLYPIVEAKDGGVAVVIGRRTYTAIELCAVVILALKRAAETYLGDSVEWTVLCVPASFSRRQRDALRDAAAIAGLRDARVMNSSTAAGLTHGFLMRSTEKIAVYDLGGGTFDVSIFELDDGIGIALATGGDGALGGEEIDGMISRWFAQEFEQEYGIDISSNPNVLRQLLDVSENTKCALSTQATAPISFTVAPAELGVSKQLDRLLTRDHLNQMMEPLLERTIDPCERALSEAGLSAQDIDAVIPVGGQTRAPQVLETIRGIFGKDVDHRLNLDEAAAIGAAVQGGISQGEVSDVVLLDAISHALGLEIGEGTFVPVVERGAAIPTKKSVSIALDPSREIQVVEEDIDQTRESVSFGRLDLAQFVLPPGVSRRLEITFALDIDQNLEVTVQKGWSRDRVVTTAMVPPGRLTKREIEQSRRSLRFREDPESLRTQRRRWLSKLRDLRGRVRELYEAWAPELIETERARIETNLVNARSAEDAEIDLIREAHRWLTVSLATLETTAFMALPLEQRIHHGVPDEFVEDFAASNAECPEALRAVALNPEWTARYGVRYRLVMNPATPIDIAMRFVDSLWDEDLKEVSRSDMLPEMLRSHAKTILRMRLPPGPSLSQPS